MNIVKHLLIIILFAMGIPAGGLPDAHAASASPAAGHHHAAGNVLDHVTADDHDDGEHSHHRGCDRGCLHAHVHCCAAVTIHATAGVFPPDTDLGLLRFERRAALPYGQLFGPPLRPPRSAA